MLEYMEKEFNELVEKVRRIDPDAAIYLRFDVVAPNYSSSLDAVMLWENTPQGFDFWCELDHKLID